MKLFILRYKNPHSNFWLDASFLIKAENIWEVLSYHHMCDICLQTNNTRDGTPEKPFILHDGLEEVCCVEAVRHTQYDKQSIYDIERTT